MKKFNLPLKILFLVITLSLIGSTIYLFGIKKTPPKLTVDQILEDHLKMRFDVEPKSPEITIPCRGRILAFDDKDGDILSLPYLNFLCLYNNNPLINCPLSDAVIYTEFELKKARKDIAAHKIAWIVDSPAFNRPIEFLKKKRNEKLFDKIYTCYRPLLEKGHPYVFAPVEETSYNLKESTYKLHTDIDEVIQNKNQQVSIIASEKKSFPGHKLRHEVVSRFRDKLDLIVGRGYKPVANTSDGLLSVRYNIVIENVKEDFYFSEKIIDCILCGAVPIYRGCPSIGKFFNDAGIIQFDTLDELEVILSNLSIEDYNKRLDAIKENFNTAHCYLAKDQYLHHELQKTYPELFVKKS